MQRGAEDVERGGWERRKGGEGEGEEEEREGEMEMEKDVGEDMHLCVMLCSHIFSHSSEGEDDLCDCVQLFFCAWTQLVSMTITGARLLSVCLYKSAV